ncbi:MAG: TIGR01457 family HAD-type hydrolase [Tuberibacillus sp.]
MKKYKAYLFDLDGTVYRGRNPIPEAIDFINQLKQADIPYIFVSNNSSKTLADVADTLNAMGVPTTPENVITSSMATAFYIKDKKPDATVYVIGEEGLLTAIKEAGLTVGQERPDFVVVGIDRQLSYEKLALGCLAIRNGAVFLSTNPDIVLPTERGLIPGNGAITAALEVATGISPIFVGKPEPIIIRQALEKLNLDPSDALMVGDNYNTDIMAGIRAGVDTLLVHTGVTSKEDLEQVDTPPTYAVDSLKDWDV